VTVLSHLAAAAPRYVGLIGSRRKVRRALDALARERGVAPDFLERVRGPIGLPIGAQTPGEIAVAVAAEIVRELRSGAPELRSGPPELRSGAPEPERPTLTVEAAGP
jgi:xanthine/CO dehydrogenase XdhC/CoxF family maturation factor